MTGAASSPIPSVALAFALALARIGDAEGRDRAMRLYLTATLNQPNKENRS